MIGPVVEDTLEIFLSQFAEGVDGISDVTGGDRRLGRRYNSHFLQAALPAPMGG